MNRLPSLRNLSITIAAVIALVLFFFFLDDGHAKSGMNAQLLAGFLVIAISAAAGAYSHRKIWPDIRTHLFMLASDKKDDDEPGMVYLDTAYQVAVFKLYASAHRLLWIVTVMFSMMTFLSNSGVV